MKIFAFFLYVLNLLTFAIMGADKHAAKANLRRVPERMLFLLARLAGLWVGQWECSIFATRQSTGISGTDSPHSLPFNVWDFCGG